MYKYNEDKSFFIYHSTFLDIKYKTIIIEIILKSRKKEFNILY